MDHFEFESGRVLDDVNVEYATQGSPKYDDEGNIINAVIYCPTLKGGYSFIPEFYNLFDVHFDEDDFFFIRIFSLGTPNSCSPSSTGLKHAFPQYTFRDRINFKKQFLREKFNLEQVLGIVGEGMGGCELLTWACEYPEDMEFIIVLNASSKTYGYRHVVVKCAESIVDSSDDFFSEGYSSSLSKIVVAINRLMFLGYFSKKVFDNLSNDEIDALMDDYVDEGLFMDIHDFKFRNDCILEYDVEDKLSNITAKSLIMGVEGNLFFNIRNDVVQLADLIENSQFISFNQKNNYYDDLDYSSEFNQIIDFINQFKNKKS